MEGDRFGGFFERSLDLIMAGHIKVQFAAQCGTQFGYLFDDCFIGLSSFVVFGTPLEHVRLADENVLVNLVKASDRLAKE